MLSKSLSELSYNREEFTKAATPHNIAMKTSGYHGGLAYSNHATETQHPLRKKHTSAILYGF